MIATDRPGTFHSARDFSISVAMSAAIGAAGTTTTTGSDVCPSNAVADNIRLRNVKRFINRRFMVRTFGIGATLEAGIAVCRGPKLFAIVAAV
jgi:hypothetical protein